MTMLALLLIFGSCSAVREDVRPSRTLTNFYNISIDSGNMYNSPLIDSSLERQPIVEKLSKKLPIIQKLEAINSLNGFNTNIDHTTRLKRVRRSVTEPLIVNVNLRKDAQQEGTKEIKSGIVQNKNTDENQIAVNIVFQDNSASTENKVAITHNKVKPSTKKPWHKQKERLRKHKPKHHHKQKHRPSKNKGTKRTDTGINVSLTYNVPAKPKTKAPSSYKAKMTYVNKPRRQHAEHKEKKASEIGINVTVIQSAPETQASAVPKNEISHTPDVIDLTNYHVEKIPKTAKNSDGLNRMFLNLPIVMNLPDNISTNKENVPKLTEVLPIYRDYNTNQKHIHKNQTKQVIVLVAPKSQVEPAANPETLLTTNSNNYISKEDNASPKNLNVNVVIKNKDK